MVQSADGLTIDLVFDHDCPNVDRARAMLSAALAQVGCEVSWTEWVRDHSATPDALRQYGSPTVLVNGRDVGGGDENGIASVDAKSCRVYIDEEGYLCGEPSTAMILSAIRGVRAA